jgi:hypothetical protein
MQLQRREPTEAERKIILQQLYERIVEGCRDEKMRFYHPDEIPPGALAASVPLDMNDPAVLEDFEEQSFFMDPADSANSLQQNLLDNRFEPVRWLLQPILKKASIDPQTDSLAFRRFLSVAIQVGIKAFREVHEELGGKKDIYGLDDLIAEARAATGIFKDAETVDQAPVTPFHTSPAEPSAKPATATAAPPISSFFEAFVRQAIDEGTWKKGTEKQNRNSLNLMMRIIGDKPAGSIGRTDATTLRRTLEKLPNNLGKSPKHKTMTIQEILDQKDATEPTMSESALDRHWRTMVAFVRWLNRQDGIPLVDIDRVFGDFRWGKHVPTEQERVSWDEASLGRLFSSPIWMGFQPHPGKRYWRHQPGDVVIKDEYWWLPLLAAYHGARLEELCRLTGNDVAEVHGICVIQIRGAHLKNQASVRDVPIHSAIIKAGFLELAAEAGDGLLFPQMIAGGPDEKLGYEYSQHFSEYRKKIGVYKERMDFHSFRHLVTTRIIRGTKSILMADEITGHDSTQRKEAKEGRKAKEAESTTMGYFDGFELKQRKEAIETVQYPEIDIDRIVSLATEAKEHKAEFARRYPRVWGQASDKKRRAKA